MPMKNSNDTIGNRTRDLLVFSEMPQPTAPPRVPTTNWVLNPEVASSSFVENVCNRNLPSLLLELSNIVVMTPITPHGL
jgi:hypothetical protein